MHLTIKDLSASTELDQAAMTAVRGGLDDKGNASVDTIFQGLAMVVPVTVGVGAGSAVNNFVNVSGDQRATERTRQSNDDRFGIALGFVRGFGGLA